MLRVAVPYGELSSAQLRVLATIARDYDQPDAALIAGAQATQDKLGPVLLKNGQSAHTHLTRATPTSPRARTCSTTGFRWTNRPT